MNNTKKSPITVKCSILRDVSLGDCSNNGISKTFNSVLLVNGDAWDSLSADERQSIVKDSKLPVVKTVIRHLNSGEIYMHAAPIDNTNTDGRSWMMGGCYIKTSDSRYNEVTGKSYPIALHDRQEF